MDSSHALSEEAQRLIASSIRQEQLPVPPKLVIVPAVLVLHDAACWLPAHHTRPRSSCAKPTAGRAADPEALDMDARMEVGQNAWTRGLKCLATAVNGYDRLLRRGVTGVCRTQLAVSRSQSSQHRRSHPRKVRSA